MLSPPSRSRLVSLLVALRGAGRDLEDMIMGYSEMPAGLSVLTDTT